MLDGLSNRTGVLVQWGKTPKAKGSEKTAERAMTNGYIKRIQAYAREDAKRGVYMSKGYVQMEQAQMRRRVSPDRAGPKAEVLSAVQAALREPHPMLQAVEKMLEKLSGGGSANLKISSIHQTAEVKVPNGETIAFYSSSGGWTDIQTKEEHRFFDASTSVYLQAYREARAELRAAPDGLSDLDLYA